MTHAAFAPAPPVAIDRVSVDYRRDGAWHNVIRELSLSISPGEAVGLAGESGCGKSTLASLLLGERQDERRITAGTVRFDGLDMYALPRRDLQRLRGGRIGVVPQNGGTSLTPTRRIGRLFDDMLRRHRPGMRPQERARAAQTHLARIGIADPAAALTRFPHQFSGGQQQRIALALAMSCEPDLLVLDEPTTGQDALIRRGLISLLRELRREARVAMLYVTHDLATLSEICDRVAIMYAGEIVETGPVGEVLGDPRHPYTRGLVAALPRLDAPPEPGAALRGTLDRRHLPAGCRFAPRCPYAQAVCAEQRQALEDVQPGRAVACRRWRDIADLRERAIRSPFAELVDA
jgi:peptide/nickel transport system ATP-binding protein